MLTLHPLNASQAQGVHGTNACGYITLRLVTYFVHSSKPHRSHIEAAIRQGVADWEQAGALQYGITMAEVHRLLPPAAYDLVEAAELFGVHLASSVSVDALPATMMADGFVVSSLNEALNCAEQRFLELERDHGMAVALTFQGHTLTVAMQRLADGTHCFHAVDSLKRDAKTGTRPDDSGSGVWVVCSNLDRLKLYLHELLPPCTDEAAVRTQLSAIDEYMMYTRSDGRRTYPSSLFTLIMYTGRTEPLKCEPMRHSAVARYVI